MSHVTDSWMLGLDLKLWLIWMVLQILSENVNFLSLFSLTLSKKLDGFSVLLHQAKTSIFLADAAYFP